MRIERTNSSPAAPIFLSRSIERVSNVGPTLLFNDGRLNAVVPGRSMDVEPDFGNDASFAALMTWLRRISYLVVSVSMTVDSTLEGSGATGGGTCEKAAGDGLRPSGRAWKVNKGVCAPLGVGEDELTDGVRLGKLNNGVAEDGVSTGRSKASGNSAVRGV